MNIAEVCIKKPTVTISLAAAMLLAGVTSSVKNILRFLRSSSAAVYLSSPLEVSFKKVPFMVLSSL